MASLIETLIDVLDKENTEYQGLLKLSEEKTTAIVNGNVERLQEVQCFSTKFFQNIYAFTPFI